MRISAETPDEIAAIFALTQEAFATTRTASIPRATSSTPCARPAR